MLSSTFKRVNEVLDSQMDNSSFQDCFQSQNTMVVWKAIKEEDCHSLREFLESKDSREAFDVVNNSRDVFGLPPLHWAVRFNLPELALLLLRYGAAVNDTSPVRPSPLFSACRFRHTDMIKILMQHGADPVNDLCIGSALHVVGQFGDIGLAELIFEQYHFKPPVNKVDSLGMTPLHYAARQGETGLCLWLIKRGANAEARDIRMVTPFMLACKKGHMAVVHAFTSRGNNRKQMLMDIDDEGMAPLHFAVSENKIEVVQSLLHMGADANAVNLENLTPLHLCGIHGHHHLIPLLVEFGAQVDRRDSTDKTPLHRACVFQRTNAVIKLIEKGADMNLPDNTGATPLMTACSRGHIDLVALLLEMGADTLKSDVDSRTCLLIAIEQGHLDVVELLIQKCDEKLIRMKDTLEQNALHCAAKLHDIRFIDAFLGYECLIHEQDVMGRYPLHVAARLGTKQTVTTLAKVSKTVSVCNFEGKSPFFMACETGNVATITALMEMHKEMRNHSQMSSSVKCFLAQRDSENRNTLMVTAAKGYTQIVIKLINGGVALNGSDKHRNTALHIACANGHLSTVKALVQHGASVTPTNVDGESPLMVAVSKVREDIAVFLMEHDSWEKSLSIRDKNGFYCVDQMTKNTPMAVKVMLDKCMRPSEHASTDPDYTIDFNYKYIDPEPYDPIHKKKLYHALEAMFVHEREDLLTHPVCQSNLGYKWRRFGRAFVFTNWFLHVAVLAFVGGYIYMCPKLSKYLDSEGCSLVNATTNITVNNATVQSYTLIRRQHDSNDLYTLQIIIVVLSTLIYIKEFRFIYTMGRQHLTNKLFILTIIPLIILSIGMVPIGYEPCATQWRLINYGMLLYCYHIAVLFQKVDTIGIYFSMFFTVSRTIVKISILFLFFLTTISLAFSVFLRNQPGFRENDPFILTVLAMTIGELDFRQNLIMGDNTPFRIDSFAIFTIFSVIMPITLINLMIGVAVGDINKVEKKAYLLRLRRQVNFILQIDASFTKPLRQKFHTERLVIQPNADSGTFWGKLKRCFANEQQIDFIVKDKTHEHDSRLRLELDRQNDKLEELCKATQAIQESLSRLVKDRHEDGHKPRHHIKADYSPNATTIAVKESDNTMQCTDI